MQFYYILYIFAYHVNLLCLCMMGNNASRHVRFFYWVNIPFLHFIGSLVFPFVEKEFLIKKEISRKSCLRTLFLFLLYQFSRHLGCLLLSFFFWASIRKTIECMLRFVDSIFKGSSDLCKEIGKIFWKIKSCFPPKSFISF